MAKPSYLMVLLKRIDFMSLGTFPAPRLELSLQLTIFE